MEILTRKNNLLRINSTNGDISVIRNNITMYRKSGKYSILTTPNYLEVLANKKIYLSLFREVNNVHVIPNTDVKGKTSLNIYLIGDKYIEHLEDTVIQSDVDTKRTINDSCIYSNVLVVLHNSKIVIYNKYLKKLSDIPMQMKYCEKMSIIEYNGKGLMGILSSTERRALIIYDKDIMKDIKLTKKSKSIKVVTHSDKPFCILTEGNQIRIIDILGDNDRTVETEHINSIIQVEYRDGIIYTISTEGIVCSLGMEETLSTAVYVDAEGIESIGL
ncbi:hypothetical protein NEIG_02076 [Nematocida sp. ERTm5]|nr:hypothetical protein NEIG_02076 [Nematocida sp. ERTm5]